MEFLSHFIYRVLLKSLVVGGIALPFFLVATRRTPQTGGGQLVLFVAALIVFDEALLLAPRLALFSGMQWNWQGKIFELLWAATFIKMYRRLSASEVGLKMQISPDSVKPIAGIILVSSSIPILFFIMGNRSDTDFETFLFQMTLPGFSEELMYRGALLAMLNQSFGKQWTLWGARVGWGFVLSALLFGTAHLISVDRNLGVHLNMASAAAPIVGGFVLGWIRERGGSLWPCVVAHNLGNTLVVAGSLLFP